MDDEYDIKDIDVLVANFEDIVILADVTIAMNDQDPEWQRFAMEMKSIYQADLQQLKTWRANWFPNADPSPSEPRGELFYETSIKKSATVNEGLFAAWRKLTDDLLEYTQIVGEGINKPDLKVYVSTLNQRLETTSQRLERLYTLSDSVLYP